MFEKLLSRGERRFGRYFGIPKLMMILCIGMGVTYVADYLLAAVYGGTVCGAGIGLVLKSGFTTGGTDMLGVLLHRFFR